MEVVRIATLADDATSTIEHRSFEGVEIRGPAVLAVLEGVAFEECTFDATFDNFVIVVAEGAHKLGVIGIRQVRFYRCRFRNVSLIGTDQLAQALHRQMFRES